MKTILAPIHPAGWPFICLFFGLTIFITIFSSLGGLASLALTGWCIYFFRNPRRVTPLGQELIISPADGIIVKIEKVIPPKDLKWTKHPLTRISVFLNVFD